MLMDLDRKFNLKNAGLCGGMLPKVNKDFTRKILVMVMFIERSKQPWQTMTNF